MARAPRNYRKEYDDYHAKPEQKKRRADRNAARRSALKAGTVHKGDRKEVDHKGNVPTRVVSRHANRIRQPKGHGK
jgi:hypothetical protein